MVDATSARVHSEINGFIAGWKNGPAMKMHFLVKMGIFQPAMLVFQRISTSMVHSVVKK